MIKKAQSVSARKDCTQYKPLKYVGVNAAPQTPLS